MPLYRKFRYLVAGLAVAGFCATAQRTWAQEIHPLIDTEIEQTVRTFARPIWVAAGLNPDNIHIVLVDNPTLNAFVAAGQNIFVFSGLIATTDNPGQLIGVIAHETGHIAGGHLVRSDLGMENATYAMILATVLGGAAAIGAHDPGAVFGALGVGQDMAMRSYFAFSRTQEASADEAGLSFLQRAGMSPKGLLQFMQKLRGEEGLIPNRDIEYVMTHPLTQDRVTAIAFGVDRSPYAAAALPAEWNELHARMKAKLIGYLQPQFALKKYSRADTTVAGRYGRSIALWRTGQIEPALQLIDALIAEKPNDPYFHQARAQMLFEQGRIAQSIPSFKRAVELAPSAAEIRTEYAQALLEGDDPKQVTEAVVQLKAADIEEERKPFSEYDLAAVHRFLAIAYGRQGNEPLAKVELAEQSILEGRTKEGRRLALAAMRLLPAGSRDWLRAQDLLATSRPGRRRGSANDLGVHFSVGPATDPFTGNRAPLK